jgi:hypothetical protein
MNTDSRTPFPKTLLLEFFDPSRYGIEQLPDGWKAVGYSPLNVLRGCYSKVDHSGIGHFADSVRIANFIEYKIIQERSSTNE